MDHSFMSVGGGLPTTNIVDRLGAIFSLQYDSDPKDSRTVF